MDLSDRMFGKYTCDSCMKTWISLNATEDGQECRKCGEEADTIKYRPLEYSVSQFKMCNTIFIYAIVIDIFITLY